MVNTNISVAVTSRSFSKNIVLREELFSKYKNVTFNDLGLKLEGSSLVEFLSGHEKAITALEKIDNKLLEELSDLKVISKYGRLDCKRVYFQNSVSFEARKPHHFPFLFVAYCCPFI